MKQRPEYRVGMGASSIMMILVTLALAALSLLSFYVARSNAALSQRNRDMVVSYYNAAAEVQRTLAELDEAFTPEAVAWRAALDSIDRDPARADVRLVLLDGGGFSMAVDAGGGRELAVEGTLGPAAESGLTLKRHQLETAPGATGEGTLNVYLPQ